MFMIKMNKDNRESRLVIFALLRALLLNQKNYY